MKYLYLLSLVSLSFGSIRAQEGFVGDGLDRSIKVFDANGKPFVNPPVDIEGTPFYKKEWKYGIIRLQDSTVYKHIPLRINLQSQEIHFLTVNKLEMSFPPGFVKEIIFSDSLKSPIEKYDFMCGFPRIDNQDENNFYRIISDGKIRLLESLRTTIIVDKNDLSGEVNKEYRTYEDYYLFTGVSITRIKKDKGFYLDIMKSKRNEMENYFLNHKVNFKSANDIQALIEFYNKL